jgi:hypothetical protein
MQFCDVVVVDFEGALSDFPNKISQHSSQLRAVADRLPDFTRK